MRVACVNLGQEYQASKRQPALLIMLIPEHFKK